MAEGAPLDEVAQNLEEAIALHREDEDTRIGEDSQRGSHVKLLRVLADGYSKLSPALAALRAGRIR